MSSPAPSSSGRTSFLPTSLRPKIAKIARRTAETVLSLRWPRRPSLFPTSRTIASSCHLSMAAPTKPIKTGTSITAHHFPLAIRCWRPSATAKYIRASSLKWTPAPLPPGERIARGQNRASSAVGASTRMPVAGPDRNTARRVFAKGREIVGLRAHGCRRVSVLDEPHQLVRSRQAGNSPGRHRHMDPEHRHRDPRNHTFRQTGNPGRSRHDRECATGISGSGGPHSRRGPFRAWSSAVGQSRAQAVSPSCRRSSTGMCLPASCSTSCCCWSASS